MNFSESEGHGSERSNSKGNSASAKKKYLPKGQEALEKPKNVNPFSTAKEEVNQAEDQLDAAQPEADFILAGKAYSAKHITLINNEIELEEAVVKVKACKAKLKAALKHQDELKKLRHSLMVDPEAESEWGSTNVWSVGSPNLEARGVGTAREKHTNYFLNLNLFVNHNIKYIHTIIKLLIFKTN